MEVYEALTLLRDKAARDPALRKSLLETRHSRTPLAEFCRISTQAGVELSGSELRAEVMANYLRHEHLPDGTFLSENARYQQTYGMLSEEGVIIQQSYNKSQAASFLAA